MEKLEMLVVEENGQVAINFEALELKTSKEFVRQVKVKLENGATFIDITESNYYINVLFVDANYGISLSYGKKWDSIDLNMLNIAEMKKFQNYFESKYFW